MIIEEYVTLEVAKLLRDHDFNARCRAFYKIIDGKTYFINADRSQLFDYCNNDILKMYCTGLEDYIAAPTIQMAKEWLRINLHLFACTDYNSDLKCYCWSITNLTTSEPIPIDGTADGFEDAEIDSIIAAIDYYDR